MRHSFHQDCQQPESSRFLATIVFWYTVLVRRMLPFHATKVAHAQPSFINIDDSGLILEFIEKLEGKLLSQNQVSNRIFMKTDGLDFFVSHAHVIFHNFSNLILLVLPLLPFVEFIGHFSCRIKYFLPEHQLLNLLLDLSFFDINLSFLRNQFGKVTRIVRHHFYQFRDGGWSHSEMLCYRNLVLFFYQNHMHSLHFIS